MDFDTVESRRTTENQWQSRNPLRFMRSRLRLNMRETRNPDEETGEANVDNVYKTAKTCTTLRYGS